MVSLDMDSRVSLGAVDQSGAEQRHHVIPGEGAQELGVLLSHSRPGPGCHRQQNSMGVAAAFLAPGNTCVWLSEGI